MKDLFKSSSRLLILIVVVLLVISLVFLFASKVISRNTKLVETNSGQATITQAYVSVSAMGGNSKDETDPDMAVLQYSPLINISTGKEIKSFEIKNVKLTNSISGTHFIVWPKHFEIGQSSNYFYEPMGTKSAYSSRKNEGNSFEYKVVDNQKYTDEIGKNGGFVDFRYVIWGLGQKIDYQNILNTQKIYSGGKEMQYAGLKQGDISSPIEFDAVIVFVDKTKAIKHFALSTNFEEVYNQGFSFSYNSSDYVGKAF